MSPRVSEQYKQQKKTDLLKAAKQVFTAKGYHRATMQDLMDAAGVSRGALYAYFDNIEHVYEELLRLEDEEDALSFQIEDGTQTYWKQLTEWLLTQQKGMEAGEPSLTLANAEYFLSLHYRTDSGNESYMNMRYQRLIEVLTLFFQKGVSQGEFNPSVPIGHIARYLISCMDGIVLNTARLGHDITKVDEQMEMLVFSLKSMLFRDGYKGD